jgi:hypothetical protein
MRGRPARARKGWPVIPRRTRRSLFPQMVHFSEPTGSDAAGRAGLVAHPRREAGGSRALQMSLFLKANETPRPGDEDLSSPVAIFRTARVNGCAIRLAARAGVRYDRDSARHQPVRVTRLARDPRVPLEARRRHGSRGILSGESR